ncbi:thiazole biosynthesis adenylyltransferase ThiF [Paenibacillus albicereus]|uniref:Thiazole biosynthesis adenylyltransferase ThiF n=1 Tax=Paenibacillus albicereus TaxID=2726185 RepID=A0A6H2H0B2_9BACL|nr:ThiF family adenylyltransferase [Paenibacillus albicereus]QJC53100.1 thiazole biosynthesis adenylyltransferase ThiF [Paenibacillus albicereus]
MSGAGRPPVHDRYVRQTRFAPIGPDGQQRLGGSVAAVVGVGALGCVIASHLARSGVGELRLIDRDVVELSNLQRQLLYDEEDAAASLPKAEAAAAKLRRANGSISIRAYATDLHAGNADELLGGAQLILDGTDNFQTRYLLNDYAVRAGIPWIYGGAVGGGGMTMSVLPGSGPCYRCLFPEPPASGLADTCETAGVVSPLVDVIGSLQAMEAIKWLAGRAEDMRGSLLQLDLWRNSWMPLGVAEARRADCPCCGRREFPYLEPEQEAAAALCGRSTVQVRPAIARPLDLRALADRLSSAGEVRLTPYSLRYERDEQVSVVFFPDSRALIQGMEDPIKAKAVYADILG